MTMSDQDTVFVVGSIVAIVALLLWVLRCAYRGGVLDGYRTAEAPNDVLWNRCRRILRLYGVRVNDARPWKRAPGDEECADYEKGEPNPNATCETDGHYLCGGCVLNVHRQPDHDCKTRSSCYQPELVRKERPCSRCGGERVVRGPCPDHPEGHAVVSCLVNHYAPCPVCA